MKKFTASFVLILFIKFSSLAQVSDCNCYTAKGLKMTPTHSIELVLTNACSNQAYLNMYVISSKAPFDTLARWEQLWGFVPPSNTDHSSFLQTNLTKVPDVGTYRISIRNGTMNCDSLKFSGSLGVKNTLFNSSFSIYPNPNNGIFYLKGEINGSTIEILNMLGEKIHSQKINSDKMELDLSAHAKGVYFYQIKNGSKTSDIGKIIIK